MPPIGVFLRGVHPTDAHLVGVVYLTGMHLTDVHLTAVHLTAVHLIGVYLTGVHLIGVSLTLPIPYNFERSFLGEDILSRDLVPKLSGGLISETVDD